jgi:tetratricopeptide (TPR) repeat protein
MKYHVGPKELINSGPFGKITHLFATAMLMLTLSFVSFGQTPDVRKAFRSIDIEQPSKGLSALEQLVKANPENSNFLYYLGLAQLRTGAKDKALASFEKGISLNEKDGLNYAGKGHIRLLEKNPSDAKAQFDKALQVSKSKDVGVLKAVAEAYLTDTKYLLDAINLLNKAKTINGTDPDVHLLLGDAFLMQNAQQGGEAVSSYERAAKADPKSGKPHYKVAKIYQRARADDIAISSFEKAVAADPEYGPAYLELGEIYYADKQAEKAVQAMEKYLAITENPGQAKFKYAFFLVMAKQLDKANAIFKEVISNPNAPTVALKYYAYSLIEQSKNETEGGPKTTEARKIMDQYFQKAKPEELTGSDYTYLGKLQLKTKEDSLANETLTKAVELDSTQVEAAQLNAETYFKRRKYDKAIPAYIKLISMRKQPLMSEVFNLGRSYFYESQFQKADSMYQIMIQKMPENVVGYQYSGKARQQIDTTGSQALANPMFEKVIEKASTNPEKYKKELIEANWYLFTYYVQVKPDGDKAKEYVEKVLELDPNHAQAIEAIKIMNQPAQKSPTKGGKD